MTDRFGSLVVRGAAMTVALMLAAACNGDAVDGSTEPSDAAASPDVAMAPSPSPDESLPSPTPTPTAAPTGPDDEGWAEHLGLTEEELEQRRASDDFLEFAKPRRAREHPRFSHTHRRIGLQSVPGDELSVGKGDWGWPLNRQAVARQFLPPFRDTLLAEGLKPAPGKEIPGVGGSYVYRIGRDDANDRQLLMAVAFYVTGDQHRARVAMAAADVHILDRDRNEVELTVVESDNQVADVAVGVSWEETYKKELHEPVGAWLDEYR